MQYIRSLSEIKPSQQINKTNCVLAKKRIDCDHLNTTHSFNEKLVIYDTKNTISDALKKSQSTILRDDNAANLTIKSRSQIALKKETPQQIKKLFQSKSWCGSTLYFTDETAHYLTHNCKQKTIKEILKICIDHQNPLSITTKNIEILDHLYFLKELNNSNLLSVFIPMTTSDEKLRSNLEPRTSSCATRFNIIKQLSKANIPVGIIITPIISGINDHSMYELLRQASLHGAQHARYTSVQLKDVLSNKYYSHMKDSKASNAIRLKFKLYCNQFGLLQGRVKLNTKSFVRRGQLSLF